MALAALGLTACASVGPSAPVLSASSGDSGAGRHGSDKPYEVGGRWYYPHAQPGYDEIGSASWYGQEFHNRHTADGEIFDQFSPSAAHKTLPLPCIVEVTNLDNGRSLKLRVNDRGPFVGDRILDVSRAAADMLGFRSQGLTRVRVRYIGPAAPLAPFSYAHAEPARAPARRSDTYVEEAAAGPAAPIPYAAIAPTEASEPTSVAPAPGTEAWNADDDAIHNARAPAPVTMAVLPPTRPLMPPPVTPGPPAPASGAFAVQAGAFANRDNAQRAVDELAGTGAPSIRSTTTSRGMTLYRVVLAGYPDAGAAEAARIQVVAAGFGDARVVTPF